MYDVKFTPEHYSPVCRATIPEVWTARYVGNLPKGFSIYAEGDTRAEAVRLCQAEFARFAASRVP